MKHTIASFKQPGTHNGMTAAWHTTISDIEMTAWSTIFGTGSLTNSYALLKVVEQTRMTGITPYYLVMKENGSTVAIIPCFVKKVALDLFAKDSVKRIFHPIQRIFPAVFMQNAFFIGTSLSICSHVIGVDPRLSEGHICCVLSAVTDYVKSQALLCRCGLIVIKEIPQRELAEIRQRIGTEFLWVESLPNAILPIVEQGKPFPSGLRTKYRRKIKPILDDPNEKIYTWTLEQHFSRYADRLFALYDQVYKRSSTQFERLLPDFFIAMEKEMSAVCSMLICRNTAQTIVAFVLLLDQPERLVPLYIGIDYAERDAGNLYKNCMYKTIFEAENRGKKLVPFGQTSYEVKAYIGAVFERMYVGVNMLNPLLNSALKIGARWLFPRHILPSVRCYSDAMVQEVESMLDQANIVYEHIKKSPETK